MERRGRDALSFSLGVFCEIKCPYIKCTRPCKWCATPLVTYYPHASKCVAVVVNEAWFLNAIFQSSARLKSEWASGDTFPTTAINLVLLSSALYVLFDSFLGYLVVLPGCVWQTNPVDPQQRMPWTLNFPGRNQDHDLRMPRLEIRICHRLSPTSAFNMTTSTTHILAEGGPKTNPHNAQPWDLCWKTWYDHSFTRGASFPHLLKKLLCTQFRFGNRSTFAVDFWPPSSVLGTRSYNFYSLLTDWRKHTRCQDILR